MANVVQIQQEAGWKTIESSPTPVLVDFWADWCGPCRMLGPTIDKLAEGYGSRMSFAKVNVDEMPDLACRFSVRSIPTLILLREGKILERVVGLRSYAELARLLDQTLSPSTPDKQVES